MSKIAIIGPAFPYRGGIADFNERMALELSQQGHAVEIITFTLQYPAFLFPGKSQFKDQPSVEGLSIRRSIHALNPFNWIKVGNEIANQKFDQVIIRYWIPFMAPALGKIARMIKKNSKAELIGLVDNAIPHEKRPGDTALTKYFIKPFDRFMCLSESVKIDLKALGVTLPITVSPHPIYDIFGEPVDRSEAIEKLKLDPQFEYLLFFGLIRNYKGLDLLLQSLDQMWMQIEKKRLIIAGEFYDDIAKYQKIISDKKLQDQVIICNEFIPESEVKFYFSAASVVVQPYKTATQSGISQIAIQMEKPMIVTNVGGLKEMVTAEMGYVVEPEVGEIDTAIKAFFALNKDQKDWAASIRKEKVKYQWTTFCEKLI